jgi:hypothetical protein
VDSATPPPSYSGPAAAQAAAPYVYAATDERPRTPREVELCHEASQFDWLYFGSYVLLDAGSVALDETVFQLSSHSGIRLLGPGLIGLMWGGTIGGGYLSLPKCEPSLVRSPPPEGDVRTSWPAAVAFALLAGATAPILVGVETGTGAVTLPWSTAERSGRLFAAGGGAFVGALLPYIPFLSPKTWSAAKELEHIRAGADVTGAFVTYTTRF